MDYPEREPFTRDSHHGKKKKGTRKSLAAHVIHELSPRHKNSFTEINRGFTSSDGVIGNALFGRGSSHAGSLFLNQIGELPLQLQEALVHYLDGQFPMHWDTRNKVSVPLAISLQLIKTLTVQSIRVSLGRDLSRNLIPPAPQKIPELPPCTCLPKGQLEALGLPPSINCNHSMSSF